MPCNKIHIGYHKTATTFLQYHVFPQLKNHKYIGHKEFHAHKLMDLIYQADRSVPYSEFKRKFEKGNFFVSFEELSGPLFLGSMRIDEMPFRIKKVFGEDAKILITIRKQDDLIKSSYIQYIHQGGTLRLKPFLEHKTLPHPRLDLNAFNFLETYNRYCEIFGESNIKVIPYEKLLNNRNRFQNDLNNFFGNEKLLISNSKIENRSLSGKQISFLRFLNNFLYSPLSQKYVIPPSIFNQSEFRFKFQRSNFLRFGEYFTQEDFEILKGKLKYFQESNRTIDRKLQLNLDDYGYYS